MCVFSQPPGAVEDTGCFTAKGLENPNECPNL